MNTIALMNELEEKRLAYHYMKKSGQLDALEEQDLLTEIGYLEQCLEEV